MLQKFTLFYYNQKNSFYTNWRMWGADREGVEGVMEEVANPCHRKNCALIFKKPIFFNVCVISNTSVQFVNISINL